MPITEHIRLIRAIQYTGTNGAEVAAAMNAQIISDSGTMLRIGNPNSGVTVELRVNEWWDINGAGRWMPTPFAAQHITKEDALRDTDTITPQNPTGTMDAVSVQIPTLMLGASAERPVTWSRPFANANYKVTFLPDANTIGRIVPTVKANSKTATGLTVVLTAGLAVSLNGVVHVIGTT